MSPPLHAYCESEIDESLVSARDSNSKSQSKAPSKTTNSTNSDSGYSSKTYATGSTGSRHSTSRTSVSSRTPSVDHTSKSARYTADAGRGGAKSSSTATAQKSASTDSQRTEKATTRSPVATSPRNIEDAMAAQPRPPNAIEVPGGYYVPGSSSTSSTAGSPTATFAPSSYHAPTAAPVPRPRTASSSRSRPTSVCITAPGGIWVQDTVASNEPTASRPTHVHAHSTSQIPAQPQQTSGSASATTLTGTWVREDALPPPANITASRPPLQHRTSAAQSDGRRASMYGAPVVQHYPPPFQQPNHIPPQVYPNPARAPMGPPSLPIRTTSRPQSQTPTIGSYSGSYGDDAFLRTNPDPNQTIRPKRTSSIQRPTILTQPPKAKSTSYYTKTSGVQLNASTTGGTRAPESSKSRKTRDKVEKHTQTAREYQERMDSRASKTSQELTAEALQDRQRSKKDRSSASEPTPKVRSSKASQSRHSRADSYVSRTETDVDRPIRLKIKGSNVEISGGTEDQNIDIRASADGTPHITVSSPSKRRETGYSVGGSIGSQLSFADRAARRRESAASTADALAER